MEIQRKNKVFASSSKHKFVQNPCMAHKYITSISCIHRLSSKCSSAPSSCSPPTVAVTAQPIHHHHINHLAVHGQRKHPHIRCGVRCQPSPSQLVLEVVVPWQSQISQSCLHLRHQDIVIIQNTLPLSSAADTQDILLYTEI